MMDISYRLGSGNDLELLTKLELEFWKEDAVFCDGLNISYPHSEQGQKELSDLLTQDRGYVMFVLDGVEIIGYLTGYPNSRMTGQLFAGQRAYLQNIYVKKPYRSQGIGTKLVSAFRQEAKVRGSEYLRLLTHINNEKAIKLYQKLGLNITNVYFDGKL